MFAAIRAKIKERGEWRAGRWGSFWHRFGISRWDLSIKLCKFEEHWALHFFCFWITLWKTCVEPKDMMESWGFSFFERSLHLNWGDKTKIIYMPWMYDHCRTEVMLKDGGFVPYERFKLAKEQDGKHRIESIPEPTDLYRETFPYSYTLKSGEVQIRAATVTVERRSWCWRGRPFRWLRWPSSVCTSIAVQFSDEVGEETGSWKGGCVGCGYDLRPNESPEQCLRRMEAERKF